MFPHPSSRLRLALGRGLGLAIEFATLGEYRNTPLEAPGAEPPPSAGAPSAQPGAAVRPRGPSSEVAPHGHDLRGGPGWAPSLALCGRSRPRGQRMRAGGGRRLAPPSREQPCITAEAASGGWAQAPP
jgi:hypothetical protein